MGIAASLGWLMQSRSPCLSVLIFHRVLEAPDPLFPSLPDAQRFEGLLRVLAADFKVLPLSDAIHAMSSGTLPRNSLAITFDDGYADNATIAAPILHRLGLTATFFVASGFIDGGRMWNDTVAESIRVASNDTLDLRDLGLGTYDISSIDSRRNAIDALLLQIKYLAPASRTFVVEQLANRLPAA